MATSDTLRSDALVFFGATGDLAYKKIFPALQAIAHRGKLDFPVIGVAKSGWALPQLLERARASVTECGGLDEEAFRHAAEEAKEGCPVSQALAGVGEITLDASLD